MKKAPLSCLLIFPDNFSVLFFFLFPQFLAAPAAVKFVVSAVRISPALPELLFLTIHQASGEAGRDPSTPKNSCLGRKNIKKTIKKLILEKVEFAARFFQGVCGFSACRRRRAGGSFAAWGCTGIIKAARWGFFGDAAAAGPCWGQMGKGQVTSPAGLVVVLGGESRNCPLP